MLATESLVPLIRGRSSIGWKWIIHNLDRFIPSDPSVADDMKPLCELSLLYAHAVQWDNPDNNLIYAQPLRQFLLDFLSRQEIVHLCRRRPTYYVANFLPYLALRMTGHKIAAFEDALRAVHRSGYPDAREKAPYRIMELRYLNWKAQLQKHPGSWDEIYDSTILRRCTNPSCLVDWEVYSITHTIFYLTSFSGPRIDLSPSQRQWAAELVETLLVNYWKKSNWDLVGELLVNLIGLGHRGTPLFDVSAIAFLNAWRDDGTMPGPTFKDLGGPPADKRLFAENYHTTLVALFFCEAYLYRFYDHVKVDS